MASLELLLSQMLSSDKVIELGCGEAELLLYINRHIGAKELYGVDIDEEKLAKAQTKGVKVVKADLNNAPYHFQTASLTL